MSSKAKQANFGAVPTGGKNPVGQPPSYNELYPAWRIQQLQMVDPYGWHALTTGELLKIRTKLAEFENKNWNQIFVVDRSYNHSIAVADFDCPRARAWMRRHMPDQDLLWTLRLGGTERIWGILRNGIFYLLFWDPEHQIKLSPKRNT